MVEKENIHDADFNDILHKRDKKQGDKKRSCLVPFNTINNLEHK